MLVSNGDDEKVIKITINIETNHVHNQLDTVLQSMENVCSNLAGYKLLGDKKALKEEKAEKAVKAKRNKAFGSGGGGNGVV